MRSPAICRGERPAGAVGVRFVLELLPRFLRPRQASLVIGEELLIASVVLAIKVQMVLGVRDVLKAQGQCRVAGSCVAATGDAAGQADFRRFRSGAVQRETIIKAPFIAGKNGPKLPDRERS